MNQHNIHLICCASTLIFLSCFCTDVNGASGFRYGSISWMSSGNAVNFTIQCAFQQVVQDIAVGDIVQLTGQESPQFLFGDSSLVRILRMKITSFSMQRQWVMGEVYLNHHYSAPVAPDGSPWNAQFTGCCRLDELQNNAGRPWVLTADIDLNRANKSPLPKILPLVTIPYSNGSAPRVTVASDDFENVEWSLGTPFDVGGSIKITPSNHSSYVQVNIGQLYSESKDPALDCTQSSSSPGCMFRLLQAQPSLLALTVEGWVRSLTTDIRSVFATSVASPECNGTDPSNYCKISTMTIMMDKDSITVGHQLSPSNTNLTSETFRVCETRDLCDELNRQYGPAVGGPLADRWVHLTVIRRINPTVSLPGCNSSYGVIYQVYVNGNSLGSSATLCPPVSSGSSSDRLYFGAYHPSLPSTRRFNFNGYLQEWRLWHGVLAPSVVVQMMSMPLRQNREAFTGDPTVGSVTPANFESSYVLLADYDFDVACDGGCPVDVLRPQYPKGNDARFLATAAGNVTSASSDSSGAVFWRSAVAEMGSIVSDGRLVLRAGGPGQYQITLYLSYLGGRGKVPVDFVVELVAAAWDGSSGAFRILDPAYAGNLFLPNVSVSAAVQPRVASDRCRGPPMDPMLPAARPGGPCVVEYSGPPGSAGAADLTWCGYGECQIDVFAGTLLRLRLDALDPQGAADPTDRMGFGFGRVPAGMRFAPTGARGVEVEWTPCAVDVGLASVCFQAWDAHGAASASSDMKCVQLRVVPDPAPTLALAPSDGMVFTMGRRDSLQLLARHPSCLQPLRLDAESALPAGMALLAPEAVAGAGCNTVGRRAEWKPGYAHGGLEATLCFAAAQVLPEAPPDACPRPAPQRAVGCITVRVERCRYALGPDQQLQQVAAAFGVDWMRLWSLNAGLLHPDYVLFAEQVLWVGHLFRAAGGETAEQLAGRMGMGVAQLQLLNMDVRAGSVLAPGQLVCVVPDSCRGAASSVYAPAAFADPSFLGRGVADSAHVSGAAAAALVEPSVPAP